MMSNVRRADPLVAFVPLAPWLAVGAWLLAIGTLLPFAWRGAERAP